jgi:predicted nucleotidyltransferase
MQIQVMSYHISSPEVAATYTQIESGIRRGLVEGQSEWQDKFQKDYPFVGAIIYGSWAKGYPHRDSDLDLTGLVISDVSRAQTDEFDDRMDSVTPRSINFIHHLFDISVNDPRSLTELNSSFYRNFKLVTPYPAVEYLISCAQRRASFFQRLSRTLGG